MARLSQMQRNCLFCCQYSNNIRSTFWQASVTNNLEFLRACIMFRARAQIFFRKKENTFLQCTILALLCIFNKLSEKNQLGNTYILFISNINAKKFTKIQ